ncbi:helix-turn-helix transcriptional regulator [Maridesulfovibrio sp.]|uniref:helix-turn-helix domain-containing protein n=1 Tax=Maridesulfovibrio sp. TaxID=2795000 RepID=UPI002A188D35|nr:helix-turn-helix transcriptional regulator [Maridesulfovibrio sp.]
MPEKSLGDRIRHLRGDVQIIEFAKRYGINKNTLWNYEKGVTSPKADFLKLLALDFGVSMDWLFFGEDPSQKFMTAAHRQGPKEESKSCSRCYTLDVELYEERSLNRELVLESKEQSKEIRELNKENRQLTKDNRELVRENRDLGKENMKLVRQLASQGSPDLMPRNAKASKGSSIYSPAHCRLPEDARNKDKYEERQE